MREKPPHHLTADDQSSKDLTMDQLSAKMGSTGDELSLKLITLALLIAGLGRATLNAPPMLTAIITAFSIPSVYISKKSMPWGYYI